MSRVLRVLLILIMCAAAATAGVLAHRYRADGRQLLELNQELTRSRARWEKTADEKVELQIELEDAQNALREANLTLEENSAEKAEKIRAEIETLKTEIAALGGGQPEAEPQE